MENIAVLVIPVLVGAAMLRLILLPVRWLVRLGLHGFGGLLCLWLLNSVAAYTGILFPLNLVTILIAGIFGVPGMFFLALLELL